MQEIPGRSPGIIGIKKDWSPDPDPGPPSMIGNCSLELNSKENFFKQEIPGQARELAFRNIDPGQRSGASLNDK
jgi:hypothetical protein